MDNSKTTALDIPMLIGNSGPMKEVKHHIQQVSHTDSMVFIHGESGTGKEVVARAIHGLSKRSKAPFIALNCAAIPKELMESQLFGHEKGAFTGAHATRIGCFEMAHQGTLFLDEIAEMPTPMQAKLLRVLQEKTFERVGGNKSIQTDVRIIAATNKDLARAIQSGEFREDLFYRLNVFPIYLPTLSQRREDIPMLIESFLLKNGITFAEDAKRVLSDYAWPGNVRELQNFIERLSVLYPNQIISKAMLPELERPSSQKMQNFSHTVLEKELPFLNKAFNLKNYLDALEVAFIQKALEDSHDIVASAAHKLGLNRTTLVEKMRKHHIERKHSRKG